MCIEIRMPSFISMRSKYVYQLEDPRLTDTINVEFINFLF